MKSQLKNVLTSSLLKFDLRIGSREWIEALEQFPKDVDSVLAMPAPRLLEMHSWLGKSKAQLRQDLFVLNELDFKTNGYFVEFGATNGVDLSNTHLLEKHFGWTGILAEPARSWHGALRDNRTCSIETRCVWRDSVSVLNFNEAAKAELSTITSYNQSDGHAPGRIQGQNYSVDTISLNDLLEKHHAPKEIDYLSIDTEGSEFEILSHFDFEKFHFRVITCEHNFTPMRQKIFDLLTAHGYGRKYLGFSKWDDWYVKLT